MTDLQDPVGHLIQEITVMGHHDDGAFIVF